tara:strand:+ start:84 stop:1502 length:1419 start_codon:yes stop_codon:yes gene_type:complete
MKKVMLFIPPESTIEDAKQIGTKWPRIGSAYVAAYLRGKEAKVSILDCKVIERGMNNIAEAIKRFDPDILASGPFTEEILEAYNVFKLAKELKPEVINVIGGPHATALPEITLREFSLIDLVVYGEAEITMVELAKLESKKDLHKIDGIVYRNGKEIIKNKPRLLIKNIDKLPYPAWDLFPLDAYKGVSSISSLEKTNNPVLELPMVSARGCPFQCNFCFKTFGNGLRIRDPKNVVDELEYNYNKYGISHTVFVEGTFAADRRRGIEICEGIIRKGLHKKIKWFCETRVDRVDEEFLSKIKEAGCEEVDFGVESGDEEILRKSKKGITIPQVKKAVRLAKRVGLKIGCYFIIGHPHETKESIKKTYKLARELNPDILSVGIMIPYPGTEIRRMAKKGEGNYRLVSSDWKEYTKQRGGPLEMKNLSINEIRKIQSRGYMKYYLRPSKILFILKNFPLKKITKIMKSLLKESLF